MRILMQCLVQIPDGPVMIDDPRVWQAAKNTLVYTALYVPTSIIFGLLIALALTVLGLGIAFPGYALDLVGFTGITGPLTSLISAKVEKGIMSPRGPRGPRSPKPPAS